MHRICLVNITGFSTHKKDFHNIDLFRFDSPHLKESSNRTILALSPEQLKEIFSFKGFDFLKEDGTENDGCLEYKNKNDRNYIVKDEWVAKKYLKKDGDEYREKKNSKTYTSLEVDPLPIFRHVKLDIRASFLVHFNHFLGRHSF